AATAKRRAFAVRAERANALDQIFKAADGVKAEAAKAKEEREAWEKTLTPAEKAILDKARSFAQREAPDLSGLQNLIDQQAQGAILELLDAGKIPAGQAGKFRLLKNGPVWEIADAPALAPVTAPSPAPAK
ncbi:MAG: hypothetical protein ACO24O_10305, partial [Arenimonas sp.]